MLGNTYKPLIMEMFDNETIFNIINEFLQCSPCSFGVLSKRVPINTDMLKHGLCILLKHDVVTFSGTKGNQVLYEIHPNTLFLIIRFRRYLSFLRQKFGGEAEMITDVMLKAGKSSASEIIYTSCLKFLEIEGADVTEITGSYEKHVHLSKVFSHLVMNHYVQRCLLVNEILDDAEASIKHEDLYIFDAKNDFNLKMICDNIRSCLFSKGKKPSNDHEKLKYPDHNTYWRVNFDRLHLDFRDTLIRQYICEVNPHLGIYVDKLFELFYKETDGRFQTSRKITTFELRDALPEETHFDFYLNQLVEEGMGFLEWVEYSRNTEFQICINECVAQITQGFVVNLIRSQYGIVSAKIFKLALNHSVVDATDISNKALLDKSLTTLLANKLVESGFLSRLEHKKPVTDNYDKRPFTYYVCMRSVVRKLLEDSRKTMIRFIDLKKTVPQKFETVLHRKARYDAVLEGLHTAGVPLEDVQKLDFSLSDEEKRIVEKVEKAKNNFNSILHKLDEDMFLLQLYLDSMPSTR